MKNERLKTPYFLIKKVELDELCLSMNSALEKYWNNYIIGYSFKTNSLPWVLNYFKENSCFAEVVSDDEYFLAKEIGFSKEKIIYNGIIKSKETFLEAIKNHAIVNIDSEEEIEWLKELPEGKSFGVGIRVNFDIEKACPGQSQEPEDGGRFGFCFENGELLRAIEKIKSYNVKISGLHLHQSSKTRGLDIYVALASKAVEVASAYALSLDYIDIGGGFFGGLPNKPQFHDYFESISEILGEYFSQDKTKLIVEPGMALIGSPVDFITSVRDVKQTTYNRFVITDGSRTNIDPLMTKSSYFHDVEYFDANREIVEKQMIVGFTCMEHDRLYVENNKLEIRPGDRIIYHKVGAYTMCLSPLFIRFFPSVYVENGDDVFCVRDRWTAKEVIQGSTFL